MKAGLLLLLAVCFVLHAQAQPKAGWSLHADGGVSVAAGVAYENINARRGFNISPAVGGGVDYRLNPLIRFGGAYQYASYRREQLFTTLGAEAPVKAYGSYQVMHHDIKLGAEADLLQLLPGFSVPWLGVYLGTGVGCTIGYGVDYGVFFSTLLTQNGTTTPVSGPVEIDAGGTVTFSSQVQTTNDRINFVKPFIPLSLQVEADLGRDFSVGVKGEADFILNPADVAPKQFFSAGVLLRYHF